MAKSKDLLCENLADTILAMRQDAIFNSFFEEIRRKDYNQLFKPQGKAKHPILKEELHGHKWQDGDGHWHYQILQHGRWQYKKVGKKAKPVKSEMRKQITEGNDLMKLSQKKSLSSKTVKSLHGLDGYEVTVAYEGKTPFMSKKSFSIAGGVGWSDAERQALEKDNAKMDKRSFSSFDRELNEAINSWATKNGLKVIIERKYN